MNTSTLFFQALCLGIGATPRYGYMAVNTKNI